MCLSPIHLSSDTLFAVLWRDEELRAEDQEFLEKKENEPIPTTLSAFAKHHLYVLEKNFGKYQVSSFPSTILMGFLIYYGELITNNPLR